MNYLLKNFTKNMNGQTGEMLEPWMVVLGTLCGLERVNRMKKCTELLKLGLNFSHWLKANNFGVIYHF